MIMRDIRDRTEDNRILLPLYRPKI